MVFNDSMIICYDDMNTKGKKWKNVNDQILRCTSYHESFKGNILFIEINSLDVHLQI
jgi:hypothetical protein